MFDLGWQELFLVTMVALLVVGPKDLPRVIRSVTGWVRKARTMARDFQNSMEEVAREAELDDLRKAASGIVENDIGAVIRDNLDPDEVLKSSLQETEDAMRAEVTDSDEAASPPTQKPITQAGPNSHPAESAPEPAAKETEKATGKKPAKASAKSPAKTSAKAAKKTSAKAPKVARKGQSG